MSDFFKKIRKRKGLAAGIALILVGGGYFGYRSFFGTTDSVSYVTAAVEKGTLVVSVTGSGQTSVSDQLDIKPKVPGDAVYVGVKDGDRVETGRLVLQIDDRDAQKAVRDAEVNLESAELSLEKLKGPEGLAVPKNKEQAQEDLKTAYDDGFNTVSNTFLDLPSIISGINSILYGDNISKGQYNGNYFAGEVENYDVAVDQFRDDAYAKYQEARKDYDQNFLDYKSTNRSSDSAAIEALINETYTTTRAIAESVKSSSNLIQFYEDRLNEKNLKPAAIADTYLANLNSYTGKTNTHLLNLSAAITTIKNDNDAITNADLDVKSQELALEQRKNSLQDAKDALADYSIRAPFDGVIAKVNVKKGDSVSASTAVATLITRQRIAEISLNEVDVAKVKVGEKVNLTFDAVPDLSISGEVAEIDTIGTVTQGVVTYNVKIVFDTQDERVKPGMSVSAAIITDVKQNVLLAPNAAVKSNGSGQYVEVLVNGAPQRKNVEAGLANDTMTEIVNGLQGDERVVTQMITASASQTQTQQNTGLRIPGITGGGAFRGGGR